MTDRRWFLDKRGKPAVASGGVTDGRIGQTLACQYQYQIDISELVQGQGLIRSGDTMLIISAKRMP